MLGFCSDPVLWPHTWWTDTKNTPQTCFPIFSNCPRPSHITCPFCPIQFHSSMQPASVPKLWPAFCCLHSEVDLMTKCSFPESNLWSFVGNGCMHAHQVSTSSHWAHPSFSPNLMCTWIGPLQSSPWLFLYSTWIEKYLSHIKRTQPAQHQ